MHRLRSACGIFATAFCAAGVAIVLLVILGYVVREGIGALSLAFATQLPRPVGIPGGGVGNGIVGSAIIVGLAAVAAIPIGALTGVFLTYFGHGPLAATVRFLSDVLAGIPSIAIGLFAYTLLVAPMGHFSAWSASFAFAILMLPVIITTTESAIKGVARELYESAIALGIPPHRAIVHVILPSARAGITTGMVLAIARVTGETAPLLFTAFGNLGWAHSLKEPIDSIPVLIFNYAISPYPDWHRQAWAGALVLLLFILIINISVRFVTRDRLRKQP